MIKVLVYWSNDEYRPSVYFCDSDGAWALWWALIGNPSLIIPESKPYAIKVELYDSFLNTKINPKKGSRFNLGQTYRGNI